MNFVTILLLCAICTSDPDTTPKIVLLDHEARVIVAPGEPLQSLRTYVCECSLDDENEEDEDAQPTSPLTDEPNPVSE